MELWQFRILGTFFRFRRKSSILIRTTKYRYLLIVGQLQKGFVGVEDSFCATTMKKSAIYTVGRQLNDGDMYIFSVFDLEPAGLLVILCCSTHNNTKYIDGLKSF
jgi:hypothetical protein